MSCRLNLRIGNKHPRSRLVRKGNRVHDALPSFPPTKKQGAIGWVCACVASKGRVFHYLVMAQTSATYVPPSTIIHKQTLSLRNSLLSAFTQKTETCPSEIVALLVICRVMVTLIYIQDASIRASDSNAKEEYNGRSWDVTRPR